MDFSNLAAFQPYQYSAMPDLSLDSTPTFSDFDMVSSPFCLEGDIGHSQSNQQYFDLNSLPFPLSPPPSGLGKATPRPQTSPGVSILSDVHAEFQLPEVQSSEQTPSTSLDAELSSPTPTQDRRKLQNRAAQRAFRERRQLRNRETQARNTVLEKQVASMADELARMKTKLARLTARNVILQARLRASSMIDVRSRTIEWEHSHAESPMSQGPSDDEDDDDDE